MGKGLGLVWLSGERSQVDAAVYQSRHRGHESCQLFAAVSYPLLRAVQMVTTALANDKGTRQKES